MRAGWVLVGILLAVLGVGCDSGQGASDDGPLIEVLAEGIRETIEPGGGSLTFTPDEARCYAGGIVDVVGSDRARRATIAGVWNGDLGDFDLGVDERTDLVQALGGCIDLHGQVAAVLRTGFGLPAEMADCAAERYLATDAARDQLTQSNDPDLEVNDRALDALREATEACSAEADTASGR